MYVEVALVLFAIGLFGLVAGNELKRIIGLAIALAAPNLLLIYAGAHAVVAITILLDTAILVVLMLLYLMEARAC